MDRWYKDGMLAYLHNVHGPSFPGKKMMKCVPSRVAGPRGSRADKTLQEMMAPTSVRFFNRMHWG